MPNPPERPEWYVSLPLSDLNKLRMDAELMDTMKRENAQLRNELNGLRNMFTELQIAFGELRREIKGR